MAGTPQATGDNSPIQQQSPFTPATITIGTVTFDDNAPLYIDQSSGVFTDYWCVNRYETDGHIYVMPVTSPAGFQGNNAAFCRLAGPVTILICDWTAERVGSEPELPISTSPDSNKILLDVHIEPAMLMAMADGETVVYRTSGTYVYGIKNTDMEPVSHPRPPWMAPSVNCGVPTSVFQQGILFCGGDSSYEGSGGDF